MIIFKRIVLAYLNIIEQDCLKFCLLISFCKFEYLVEFLNYFHNNKIFLVN